MHLPRVLYREAVETDFPQLVGIHYAAVRALASSHYPPEVLAAWSPPPDEARQRWLAGILADGAVLCTVAATPDRQLVGFCIAEPEQSLLRAIYVHPAFAGNGIGRSLLERAEAQCRDRGLRSLWLNASYNAEAFYMRCGYKALGPVTYPLSEEASMGAVRMVKHLGAAA